MSERKAELEKKRKKLEELRKARDHKKKETADKELLSASPTPSDTHAKERVDVNKLVHELIGETLSPSARPTDSSPNKSPKTPVLDVSGEIPTPISSSRKKPVKLVVDTLAPINIKPRAVEVYAKQTQTDVVLQEQLSGSEDEEEISNEPAKIEKLEEKLYPDTSREKSVSRPTVELSSEQAEKIMMSEDFSTFFDRASRLVERALCEPSDILFDCIVGEGEEGGGSLASLKVVKKYQFSDDRWSHNRIVTSMDWSDSHPELLLVSYHTNPNIPHDPDGVALIWDLKFKKDTPDYIFNCQSPVMSIAFSKFHPSYVIGGTYSGQIVLWDTRSGKRTPIQRSPLSSGTHTQPVYCLDVVGTQNAHNLISVSTDGKMCSWNLDMLTQPQESLELINRQTRPVAVSCLSFPTNDVNKFIIGSEECVVYQGQRHGSKPGTSVLFEGHYGPITAVSAHRATGGQVDHSHLFLSSSFDWTIKLWSTRLQNEQQLTSKTGQPLCSFDNNNEYVYDVQWSPVHPALFASGDGEGRLDFWNINVDSEIPILTENLDAALSKLHWSPTGHHLACGDAEGKVHIYEAGEALYSPHPEEWVKLQQTLLELQDDQEMTL